MHGWLVCQYRKCFRYKTAKAKNTDLTPIKAQRQVKLYEAEHRFTLMSQVYLRNCSHGGRNAAMQGVYQWNKKISVNTAGVRLTHVDQGVDGLTGQQRSFEVSQMTSRK